MSSAETVRTWRPWTLAAALAALLAVLVGQTGLWNPTGSSADDASRAGVGAEAGLTL